MYIALIIALGAIFSSLLGAWIAGKATKPGQGREKITHDPQDPHNLKWEDPLEVVLKRFK